MDNFKCPLCGRDSKCKIADRDFDNNEVKYYCQTYNAEFILHASIYVLGDGELPEKLLNLISEFLLQNKFCEHKGHNYPWHFLYEPECELSEHEAPYFVNLNELLINYPKTLTEVSDRAMINLSLFYPNYGDRILPHLDNKRLFFEIEGNNAHQLGMPEILADLDYLTLVDKYLYIISAMGWKKVEELRKQELTIKQAFIAMQFGDDTKEIREAFRQAIRDSHYSPRFIDEKEHNNQIVPEILFEIERSKFMVVDVTYPNYGAYYEAGYAQALGKEVIICCKKAMIDSTDRGKRPHFDIAQKSMIIWDNEEELIEKLKRRIEATVR